MDTEQVVVTVLEVSVAETRLQDNQAQEAQVLDSEPEEGEEVQALRERPRQVELGQPAWSSLRPITRRRHGLHTGN